MKTRVGFVSNSSSSSFIVIGSRGLNIPSSYRDTLLVPDDYGGETEFGWQEERYYDIGSKINFAYLQAVTDESGLWLKMLENCLKDKLEIKDIKWNLSSSIDDDDISKVSAYIDHASSASEGRNTNIFDTDQHLCRFLFDVDSYIQCGNDN